MAAEEETEGVVGCAEDGEPAFAAGATMSGFVHADCGFTLDGASPLEEAVAPTTGEEGPALTAEGDVAGPAPLPADAKATGADCRGAVEEKEETEEAVRGEADAGDAAWEGELDEGEEALPGGARWMSDDCRAGLTGAREAEDGGRWAEEALTPAPCAELLEWAVDPSDGWEAAAVAEWWGWGG